MCPARAAAQALLHELRARSCVEQCLRACAHSQRGILDQRAQLLGERHAAGLAQQLDLRRASRIGRWGGIRRWTGIRHWAGIRRMDSRRAGIQAPAQRTEQALGERALAGPVQALDRDELARGHRKHHANGRLGCNAMEPPPGLEDHPHARAVLAPAWPPRERPRTPTSSTAPRAAASAPQRGPSRRLSFPTTRPIPPRRTRACCATPTRTSLGWCLRGRMRCS